jgi:hypothetical protein
MNNKLKELASKIVNENTNQDEYKFFIEFADKYGMLILEECIEAIKKDEYPNAYGELTGVEAIKKRFELK